MANETVFVRYPGNPVITARAVPRANSIHNSAIVKRGDGDYAGVFRVDEISMHFTLHTGFSADGLSWEIDPEPLTMESDDPEVFVTIQSYDPRLTRMDDTYYLTWCNATPQGPAIGLATTKDFRHFRQWDNPLPPANRNCVLFPRKIGGDYAIYHRPSDRGHTPFGDIFYATSPDLVHWGRHRFVFGPETGWQSLKVGPGPHPIETDDGWLLIYHGAWRTCSGYLYCVEGPSSTSTSPGRSSTGPGTTCSRPARSTSGSATSRTSASRPRRCWRATGSGFTTAAPTPASRWPRRNSTTSSDS